MADTVQEFVDIAARLERKHDGFVWRTDLADLMVIISQLQLAMRHPENTSSIAVRTRRIVEGWIARLELSEPDIGRILRMGFDPQYDR